MKNKQNGFFKIIILIIIALLLMRYFNITITGILNYFNLTWIEIINWLKEALIWLKELFNSVK
jgi:hypothetical protein